MTSGGRYSRVLLFLVCLVSTKLLWAQDAGSTAALQTLARSASHRPTGSHTHGPTTGPAPASTLFEGFFRFPAEVRQFIPMTANPAYFRDVFVGGETFTDNPNDGDTISATIIGPGETVPEQFIPFGFHASFNGQQNCWVSVGLPPLCNSNAIDVLWFRQIQCAADCSWTMTFR